MILQQVCLPIFAVYSVAQSAQLGGDSSFELAGLIHLITDSKDLYGFCMKQRSKKMKTNKGGASWVACF